MVRCSEVQESPGGKILDKVRTNLTLEVTRPQPLLASRSGELMGVITGGLLALITSIILAIWKEKKRLQGSGGPLQTSSQPWRQARTRRRYG